MFKTKDIDLAAFIVYQGLKPIKVLGTDKEKIREFVFEDSAYEVMRSFYKEDATVQIQKYITKRSHLKRMPLIE